ncbi:MAG: uroporphyrinogen decarboxylase family protein [Lentisphaeria bacterium]|jgi:hypothetical protein|nr:uroporphyrinogen decarboxylase family protein [Lentisphaeria bacterium]MDP7743150.1 uroporphyrinogen decarboxylase family protein [Lentisphaeria bacterium]
MIMRDRMRAVLNGVIPDRVPFFPTIYIDHACVASGKRFEEALINPALGQACMLEAARRYRTDVVRFCIGPEAAWYDQKSVVEEHGRLVQQSRETGKAEGFYDVYGGGMLIPFERPGPPRTVDAVRDIPVTSAEEYLARGCLKDVAPLVRAAREDGFFVIGMCGGQSINFMVEQLGKPEAALLLFLDDPKLACALIEKAVAISLEKCKAFVELGIDSVFIGDSYASCSVISPEIYRRFCVPAYAQVVQEFRNSDVFCIMHCCGNCNPLLDDIPATGVDAIDGLDPTSGMSVAHTKERIGAAMALVGGLSCLTLLNGTPEEVYEEARRCVEAGKPGGRYVLGTGCAVPRHTPAENMVAARRAAVEHGSL